MPKEAYVSRARCQSHNNCIVASQPNRSFNLVLDTPPGYTRIGISGLRLATWSGSEQHNGGARFVQRVVIGMVRNLELLGGDAPDKLFVGYLTIEAYSSSRLWNASVNQMDLLPNACVSVENARVKRTNSLGPDEELLAPKRVIVVKRSTFYYEVVQEDVTIELARGATKRQMSVPRFDIPVIPIKEMRRLVDLSGKTLYERRSNAIRWR